MDPDVTMSTPRVQAALQLSQTRVTMLCEADGTIVWISDSIELLLGHRPADLVGTPVFDLYAPEHQEYSRMGFARADADPTSTVDPIGAVARTALVRRLDGGYCLVETFPTVMLAIPDVRGILLEWTPVPDRTPLTEAIDSVARRRPVAESLDRIIALIESYLVHTAVGVIAVVDGRWTVHSAPGSRPTGPLHLHLPPPADDVWRRPFTIGSDALRPWAGDGLDVAFRPIRGADGALLGAVVFVRGAIERLATVVTSADNMCDVAFRLAALTLADEQHRDELRAAAEVDRLTGLMNRTGLARRLADRSALPPNALVVYVDLDHFKPINDEHGHAVGDAVLAEVGARLREWANDVDVACRLGGDEFVVVCFGDWSTDDATVVLDRLAAELDLPIDITDGETQWQLRVSASLGAAVGPAADLDELMRQADASLYETKRRRHHAQRSATAGR